ncbi:hypothetical protein M1329_00185 [Candidatus Marsarchaeota archaeon]|nr:hypothetical protein [Candidatus Marsarchaeota archaeon]MCL5099869.1 hypothetical protein [Candidatus Marsarchaeota archaeon]
MLRLFHRRAAYVPNAGYEGTAERAIYDNANERAHAIAADALSHFGRASGIEARMPKLRIVHDMAYRRGPFVINASAYDNATGELRIDPLCIDDFHIAEGIARHNLELWHAAEEAKGATFYAKGPLLEAIRRSAPRLFALYYELRGLPAIQRGKAVLDRMGIRPGSERVAEVLGYVACGDMKSWGLVESRGPEMAHDVFVGELYASQRFSIYNTMHMLLRTEPSRLWERSRTMLRNTTKNTI